jgi:hypothetical protein
METDTVTYRFYLDERRGFAVSSVDLDVFPLLREAVYQGKFVQHQSDPQGLMMPASFPRLHTSVYRRFVRLAVQARRDPEQSLVLGNAPKEDLGWQLYDLLSLCSHMQLSAFFFRLWPTLWRLLGKKDRILTEQLQITPLQLPRTKEVVHMYNASPDKSLRELLERLFLLQSVNLGYAQFNWVVASLTLFYETSPLSSSPPSLEQWIRATLRRWPVTVVAQLQQLMWLLRAVEKPEPVLLWFESLFERFWQMHSVSYEPTLPKTERNAQFYDASLVGMQQELQQQDLYKQESWPTVEQMRENDTSDYYNAFLVHYMHTEDARELPRNQHSTALVQTYRTEHRDNAFTRLTDGRWDLFVKHLAVPLHNPDSQRTLDAARAEILIGCALNELRYGYSHVLSVHFVTTLDWGLFVTHSGQTERLSIVVDEYEQPEALKQWPPLSRIRKPQDSLQLAQQLIISERLDETLFDAILAHRVTLPHLRAILWQIFHALETAWYTNRFLHHDMHLGNVMLQHTDLGFSSLRDRALLYRRRGDAMWWRVPRDALQHRVVKLIDFDVARAHVPSRREHLKDGQHEHWQPVEATGKAPETRLFLGEPQRNIDPASLLSHLLTLKPYMTWLDATSDPRDLQSFYSLCEAALDIETINKRLASDVKQPVTVRSLRDTVPYPFGFQYATERGANASQALDHAFFAQYKTESLATLSADKEALTASHAVVSFALQSDRVAVTPVYTLASHGTQSSCRICGCPLSQGSGTVCGQACLEFEQIFKSKTVYR